MNAKTRRLCPTLDSALDVVSSLFSCLYARNYLFLFLINEFENSGRVCLCTYHKEQTSQKLSAETNLYRNDCKWMDSFYSQFTLNASKQSDLRSVVWRFDWWVNDQTVKTFDVGQIRTQARTQPMHLYHVYSTGWVARRYISALMSDSDDVLTNDCNHCPWQLA